MDRGKLLVSANGNGHSAITMWGLTGGLAAVFCFAMGIWLAKSYGFSLVVVHPIFLPDEKLVKNEMYNFWIGSGTFCAVMCCLMTGLVHTRISGTAVNVYENCVEGTSVVPKFPLAFVLYCSISSLQLTQFQLTYDKIYTVDVVNGDTVVISERTVQHKIYAKDAGKIRDEILSRRSAVGAA